MAISVVAYFYHFLSEEVGTLSGQFLQSDLYDLRYLDCGGGEPSAYTEVPKVAQITLILLARI